MSAVVGWNENTVTLARPEKHLNVIFNGPQGEMLRLSREGFYVRGELVPQDAKEARRIHNAFLAWMRAQGMAV